MSASSPSQQSTTRFAQCEIYGSSHSKPRPSHRRQNAIHQLLAGPGTCPPACLHATTIAAPLFRGSAARKKAGLSISHTGYAEYDEYGPIRRAYIKWRMASSASFVGTGSKVDCTARLFVLGTRLCLQRTAEALCGCGQGFENLALKMHQF